MNKSIVTFGPWNKGVNYRDDVELLDLQELAAGVNVEIDNNGVIKLRRPIRAIIEGDPIYPIGISPLLDVNADKNIGTAVLYRKGNEICMLYPTADAFGQWTHSSLGTFADNPDMGFALVYSSQYWMISQPTGVKTSYYSDGIGPGAKTWTNWPGPLPYDKVNGVGGGGMYADTYAIYLDRLFIALDDTIYFSAAGDFTKWNRVDGGGFFVVGNASGDRINFMHVMYNMLYIFTSYETFSFTYGNSPNVDAALQTVSRQGANVSVFYKDRLYCISDQGLYQFVNNTYYPIEPKIDVKYYAVTSIQGIEDNLIFVSTLPEPKILLMRLGTKEPALTEWQLPAGLDIDTYFLGIKKTTQSVITLITNDIHSYLVAARPGALSGIPTRYDMVPQIEFYDKPYPTQDRYFLYSSTIELAAYDSKNYTQYKRIYYCNTDMASWGFYDGAVSMGDTGLINKFVKYHLQVDTAMKKNYTVDRVRTLQPYFNYSPTKLLEVPSASRLPLKFELRNFQVVMSEMDVQQGERQ